MKKFILSLILFGVSSLCIAKAVDMKFSEALADQKKAAVLIYADWADDIKDVKTTFDEMEPNYTENYNFIKINIADEKAKEFNQRYHIYPNLPYVLLFKDNGRISRYLKKDCIMSKSCFKEKLDFFLN